MWPWRKSSCGCWRPWGAPTSCQRRGGAWRRHGASSRSGSRPPRERLQHLRKELIQAEGEVEELERAVVDAEFELHRMEDQLSEQWAAVVSANAKVQRLPDTIEQVELTVPPEAQVAEPDVEATPEVLNQILLKAQAVLNQIQGCDLAAATKDEGIQHLSCLQAKGEEAEETRRQREAQEAQGAEMARNLQEKEHNQLQAAEAAKEPDWQEPKKAKKGKGLGKAAKQTSSASGLRLLQDHEIGPLATAARGQEPPAPMDTGGRAASEPRAGRGLQERHRSPRRTRAGTPAQPGAEAAGWLGPAAPGVGRPNGRGDGSTDA
jgi:hypothetical protein